MQGIGVDADQGYLGEHIMTSALKKVDVAVFETAQGGPGRHVQGRRRTRSSTSSNDGVGLGKINADGEPSTPTRSRRSSSKIIDGEITDIPADGQVAAT